MLNHVRKMTLGTWADGKPATLDLPRLIESRMLIQASSGGGKSWALRRLLEVTSGHVQQVIIDPDGEFASLRERHDLVIASATGGDALAHPKTSALLATRLLETGVSAVLDIYDLKKEDREAFVKLFVDSLVNAPKSLWHPVMVVIDEAHMFADESERATSTQAVIDLATRGRKRGFCLVAATQRISDFNKSAAAQLKNKLIGNTGLDVDVKRAAFELGKTPKDAMQMLRDLQAGEFYGFGPALSHDVQIVKIGDVKTTHPKVGHRQLLVPPKPTAAIKAILPKLADLPKEAEEEARTVAELQREIATLKRNARSAPAAAPIDTKAIERRADQAGWSRGYKEGYRAGADWMARRASETVAKMTWPDKIPMPEQTPFQEALVPIKAAGLVPLKAAAPVNATPRSETPSSGISAACQKILDQLGWLESIGMHPAPKATLAAVCGVSPTSGGYFNNLGKLRSLGAIDYPQSAMVGLTKDGRRASHPPDMQSKSIADYWLSIVSGPQQEILKALLEHYPEPMKKDDLAIKVGVSPLSGGYFNNLGKLRTLGAIDYPSSKMVGLTRYVMP